MRNQLVAVFEKRTEVEMGDQRREVEREAIFEAPPSEVWRALTDDDMLAEWLAEEAEVEAVPGGDVSFGFEDGERSGTVERVEEERSFAFTWARPGEAETLVEFTLEPAVAGTRLIVVERALAGPVALAGSHWSARLTSLGVALTLVAA
jgi:uncharacterized protein YndB with AHSA1/START domain